jgi:predicted aconitase with swiveling domain/8-oxo-dGTP pyrophosphatase MutT (NUDIX family)
VKLRARPIAPGRAAGTALVSPVPFSFVGGADPETGEILDRQAGEGERLSGRTFAFPRGKGSTVGSYVIFGLAKRGLGPAAIVNVETDGIVAVGATLAGVPLVDRVDTNGLRNEDRLLVDGDRGSVELPDVRGVGVVTAILRNAGRILILRRSEQVESFRGRWSAVSGFLEGREDPRARALLEIREETGIRRAMFRGSSDPVLARDGATRYVVHPFLFDAPGRRVRLDWENVEHRWIAPGELDRYEAVPRLRDVVAAALSRSSPAPTKRTRSRRRPSRRR